MRVFYSYNSSLFLTLFIFLNVSCYRKNAVPSPKMQVLSDTITTETVTYTNFVYDLLLTNCSTCHGPGGSAEVWWLNENTYKNAVKYGTVISATIHNSTMPPPPKSPFSEQEKELIIAWVKNGYKL